MKADKFSPANSTPSAERTPSTPRAPAPAGVDPAMLVANALVGQHEQAALQGDIDSSMRVLGLPTRSWPDYQPRMEYIFNLLRLNPRATALFGEWIR